MILPLAVAIALFCPGPWTLSSPGLQEIQEPPPNVPAAADSAPLKDTVVVPSFSSALPDGKSAVWCATFQMTWDLLREQLKHPLRVNGAEELSDVLNRSTFPKGQIPGDTSYTNAGSSDQGIYDAIERDLKRLNPGFQPDFDKKGAGLVAYSYLKAALKFEPRFFENQIKFMDVGGTLVKVRAFGIGEDEANSHPKLRKQIAVIYYPRDSAVMKEFVLDPCTSSIPFQILLAKVPRKASLAEIWHEVEDRIALKNPWTGFGGNDVFLCPEIKFSTKWRFSDLEGRKLETSATANSGMTLDYAGQSIQFGLDRGGAQVESEAMVRYLSLAREFVLNGPFLVILRKRDEGVPFFALWVNNTEIMHPSLNK